MTEHLESLQEQLTEAIHRSARLARTEEDLKIGVEQALAPIRAELNITPSYETTYSPTVSVLGGGSSDAVYGHAIIEYKRPGRLATQPGQREATEELQRYLLAEANRYDTGWDTALRRMIGIALDGESIFFLRYRGARRPTPDLVAAEPVHQMSLFPRDDDEVPGFVRLGPYPVNEESVGLLVLYLRALRRRALTPEALALEFGPAGDVARALVSAFNVTVTRAVGGDPEAHPKVVTLFREWDRIFGIVYGQNFTKGAERASELAALYGVPEPVELKPLLFAVHTYYAMLMKLLAAELASLQGGSPLVSPLAGLQAMTTRQLRERLGDLENGGLFARFGVHNFLEGDFFGWYVEAWRPEFEAPLRSLARSLADFEPATGSIKPEATRDLLKKLYQYLVPKQLRHDLGEYYTPDWLAELTLTESGYDGASHHRFLDPACGSGTFLVLAIKRALAWAEDHLTDGEVLAKQILANVVGFDLNPLAVIAARTNYLLALGTLIRRLPSVEIPVYLCDSVLTPSQQSASDGQTEALFDDYELGSTVGPFRIPRAIVAAGHLPDIAALLEECVQLRYEPAEFEARARELISTHDENVLHSLRDLFSRLVTLHREDRDGLWARLLKNAFAPIFAGRFHFVVGNPPWIRWQYLSDAYRAATLPLWTSYGLFSLKGMASRLGGGEKDFSMLFTYASADHYLADGGTLAFVITQEVIKGKGAGEGFRRFRLGQQGEYLGVQHAHDLVPVQPFEGASNKTSVLVMRKGIQTTYPVPFTSWRRKARVGSIPTDATLSQALQLLDRYDLIAKPVSSSITSPWQTLPATSVAAFSKLSGRAAYQARRGAGTDPYGVFWFEVTMVRDNGTVVANNLPELGHRDVPKREGVVLESALMYPATRGADISRWHARPGVDVLLAQDPATRNPIRGPDMRVRYPAAYRYLEGMRSILLSRGSNTVRELAERTEPWAMFGIGPYTLAPFRVTWKRMASDMVAAVMGQWSTPYGAKPIIPTETTAFIPVDDEAEAHFLAAILNSVPIRLYIRTFSAPGRGFGAPAILNHIALPRFDGSLKEHQDLSELGRRAAHLAALGTATSREELVLTEGLVDAAVATLFGIGQADLSAMRKTGLATRGLTLS